MGQPVLNAVLKQQQQGNEDQQQAHHGAEDVVNPGAQERAQMREQRDSGG